jgi:arylsulfatase
MRRLHESSIIGTLNTRYRISTKVELSGKDGEGVIIAHGGRFTGWSLFMKDNQVRHEYNIYGDERFKLSSPALPPGKYSITYEFTPDSAARGAGGVATLSVNGTEVQRIHMGRTVPFAMFADDGIDVGMDGGSAVSNDYSEDDNAFKGKLGDVTVELP